LDFVNSARSVRHRRIGPGSRVAVWGDRYPSELAALVLETGAPLVRIEDGFIRSAGLGSDLTDPSSLVFDRSGIYYDPANESDLERILRTTRFSRTLIDRASRLRNEILALGISKYNFEGGHNPAPEPPKGRRSILVPGQVEDDASVRLGSPVVRSNLELLRAVRDAAPEAWILYKPHPDVLAGNRRGTVGGPELLELCDAVTKNATISACLSAVGEVHTMTSLVGFEALLRSKTVVAYGAPFYAGWGLTKDHVDMRRRDRRLTIDELVAGVLILYPRYYDWNSGLFCECEDVVRLLADKRVATIEPGIVSTIGRQFLRLSRWLGAWRHV
ncbi:MAG: capsular polysaccharide biosynthesis protein, partial [Phycisphaerae bacterium]|nr:capsular polysaccharide biosynthesis protein [Phycisphaerae bacterium]